MDIRPYLVARCGQTTLLVSSSMAREMSGWTGTAQLQRCAVEVCNPHILGSDVREKCGVLKTTGVNVQQGERLVFDVGVDSRKHLSSPRVTSLLQELV
jgi:hypothetical protein